MRNLRSTRSRLLFLPPLSLLFSLCVRSASSADTAAKSSPTPPSEAARVRGVVINVPPDEAPQEIGGGTQLNLFDDGSIGEDFLAYAGSAIEMTGGHLGNGYRGYPDSELNVHGGKVGNRLWIDDGAAFNLFGGEFLLNGSPPANTSFSFNSVSDVLTGTLSDGTSFVFSPIGRDRIQSVKLVEKPLPERQLTPKYVDNAEAPRGLRAGETLTVVDNGALPENFAAVGATLRIAGGTVGDDLEVVDTFLTITNGGVGDNVIASHGSVVNVQGGSLGNCASAGSGSVFNISGGEVGHWFRAYDGSVINISGGELNDLTVHGGSVVNVSGGTFTNMLRLNGDNVVNISGGQFTRGVQTYDRANPGAHITVTGGEFGSDNLHGGFVIGRSSVVDVSAGQFTNDFFVGAGSTVIISGGSFGDRFSVGQGSEARISGGTFAGQFLAPREAELTLVGGEFMLNGSPVSGELGEIRAIDVLTGTFEDGSVFLFSPLAGDFQVSEDESTIDVRLVENKLPNADPTPQVIGDNNGPVGLRQGQVLTLIDGGVLSGNFTAVGGELHVAGGTVGRQMEVFDTRVLITDGNISEGFAAFNGASVTMTGGTVDQGFTTFSGTTVHVTDGLIEGPLLAEAGSVIHIAGGQITGDPVAPAGGAWRPSLRAAAGSEIRISDGVLDGQIQAWRGSSLHIAGGELDGLLVIREGGAATISGGQLRGGIVAARDAELHLIGRVFLIDGVPVEGLVAGERFEFLPRAGMLAGRLADNTPFCFDLEGNCGTVFGFSVGSDALLTLMLIPEPASAWIIAIALALISVSRNPRAHSQGSTPR